MKPLRNNENSPNNSISIELSFDEDTQENLGLDSGWAWVVLAAATVAVATSTSMNATFGFLFGQFLTDMGADSTSMAIVLGASSAIFSLGLFVSGPLSKLLPTRASCLACSLVMTSSLVLLSQAVHVWQFVAIFSVAYSLASGTIFGLSFLLVNQYFDKRRGLAMAVFFGFSSIGRMILPLMSAALLPMMGINNTILVIGAVWAITILAAALHRPYQKPKPLPIISSSSDVKLADGSRIDPVFINPKKTVELEKNENRSLKVCDGESEAYTNAGYIENEITPQFEDRKTEEKAEQQSETTTENTQEQNGETERSKGCGSSLSLFRHLNFELFRNPIALLIMFSECSSWTAINHISYMISVMTREHGFTNAEIGTFMVIPAVMDLIARMTVPLMHDKNWLHPKTAYSFGLLFMAASAFGFPVGPRTSWAIMLCCGLFGFGQGCSVSHFGLVAVRYCGLPQLPSMRAFSGMLPAFFIIAFGGIIGALKNVTESYETGFYAVGAFSIIPALLWWFCEPRFSHSTENSKMKSDGD
ncbi:unnamed protein product [Notodromas monacha]|uniref:Uncharacterized protein n=1 Tax=Notodromas monacha TaxID=399045 RepID=A0A7R9BZ17_9CRUS|nr:unnamed protein product [Notodromas monacha]CAG0922752.1 unnamed protein product [Notodromas monacha]